MPLRPAIGWSGSYATKAAHEFRLAHEAAVSGDWSRALEYGQEAVSAQDIPFFQYVVARSAIKAHRDGTLGMSDVAGDKIVGRASCRAAELDDLGSWPEPLPSLSDEFVDFSPSDGDNPGSPGALTAKMKDRVLRWCDVYQRRSGPEYMDTALGTGFGGLLGSPAAGQLSPIPASLYEEPADVVFGKAPDTMRAGMPRNWYLWGAALGALAIGDAIAYRRGRSD